MKTTYKIELKGDWGKVTIKSEQKDDLIGFLLLLNIVLSDAAELTLNQGHTKDSEKYEEIRHQIIEKINI